MENYENFLTNKFSPNDFFLLENLHSSLFGEYYKVKNKNGDFFILRKFRCLSNNETAHFLKELSFLDKMLISTPRLKCIPDYFGYYKTQTENEITYNQIFPFYSYSIASLIAEHKKNKQKIPLVVINNIFRSMVNFLAYLQVNEICPGGINPSILFLDESFAVKFIYFGSFQDAKSLKPYYIKQISKQNFTNYISHEAFQVLMNYPDASLSIDPYKSETFALGLLMLELGTLENLYNKNNCDIFESEIESQISIFKQNYFEFIESQQEKAEFQEFFFILKDMLKIKKEERCNFIDIFYRNLLNKDRILYHIFLQESTIGEIQNMEWKHLRRNPLKIEIEKKGKSFYQKDFEEYLNENSSMDTESMKKFDIYLAEKEIQGISLANLSKEKGHKLIVFCCELLKVSKCIENVALWGNEDHFEKDVLKVLCEALKVNRSLKTLSLADNALGQKKKAIKEICRALKSNQVLSTLNMGGNKLGVSHKNLKPFKKLLKVNPNLQNLGLGSNGIGANLMCVKNLCFLITKSKNLITLGLSNNGLGEFLDHTNMKSFCEALVNNKNLISLNLEYNSLGRNVVTFKIFCDYMKMQSSIKSLDLGNNYLGEKSMNLILVGEMLNMNKNIVNIGLGCNEMGKNKEGFSNLLQSLKINDHVENVELDGNSLNDLENELMEIENVIKKNKMLTTISLYENQIEKNKALFNFLKETEKKYGISFKI